MASATPAKPKQTGAAILKDFTQAAKEGKVVVVPWARNVPINAAVIPGIGGELQLLLATATEQAIASTPDNFTINPFRRKVAGPSFTRLAQAIESADAEKRYK